MYSLNAFYIKAIERLLRNNSGRTITQFKVSKLFGEAYLSAAIPTNSINGFKKTGIYPLREDNFAASSTTDQQENKGEKTEESTVNTTQVLQKKHT